MNKLIVVLLMLCLLITGCAYSQERGKAKDSDSYDSVREVAWRFVEEKGWNGSEKGWKSAKVEKRIVDGSFKLLDKTYLGKEIFTVTLENALASPLIIIDPDTNEVMGYIPGE